MSTHTNAAVGSVSLAASDKKIESGFAWAKGQALAYAHHGGDAVGLWYEAALPERDAFCIRDVAHQRTGAAALGLSAHTANMLWKFAASMAKSRDYCMFWEITKDDVPAPVDYKNDADFWYNLPANFDMVTACLKEYLWSGDERFLKDETFLSFYAETFGAYIDAWDKDGDGVPEYHHRYGRRGLASYNEQVIKPYVGGDLLGAMYAGYTAYAQILCLQGKECEGAAYRENAVRIRARYLTEWYRPAKKAFYGALKTKNRFYRPYYNEGNFLPVYFGILDDTPFLAGALQQIAKRGPKLVEAQTYFPDFCYGRGADDYGYEMLTGLLNPNLKRREYPEVSFAALGAVVGQYMGITPEAVGLVRTRSRLHSPTDTAALTALPLQGRTLDVTHVGHEKTILTNHSDTAFRWQACFTGKHKHIEVNGHAVQAEIEKDAAGNFYSRITAFVPANATLTAKVSLS